MAATSGLTATVTSPPAALRASPPPVLFLRPISRCSRLHSLKAKAAAKDQDEKKPEATKKKAYSLVCTACEGNGKDLSGMLKVLFKPNKENKFQTEGMTSASAEHVLPPG
uniref:Uncharacterized protein n=1 Tax=Aegilops tauschii TaxID=37682 RepID=M8ARC3_AEGTA